MSWHSSHKCEGQIGWKGWRQGGCSGDSGEVEGTAEQGGRGRAEREEAGDQGIPLSPYYLHLA